MTVLVLAITCKHEIATMQKSVTVSHFDKDHKKKHKTSFFLVWNFDKELLESHLTTTISIMIMKPLQILFASLEHCWPISFILCQHQWHWFAWKQIHSLRSITANIDWFCILTWFWMLRHCLTHWNPSHYIAIESKFTVLSCVNTSDIDLLESKFTVLRLSNIDWFCLLTWRPNILDTET